MMDAATFEETRRNAVARLLAWRTLEGHWEGRLSSSALSTATAITALSLVDARRFSREIEAGTRWLIEHQNADGGWGDTTRSFSNISTTMLCWATLAGGEAGSPRAAALNCGPSAAVARGGGGVAVGDSAVARCEAWLAGAAGSMRAPALVAAILRRYGKDRTFSVPILTMCALKGKVGWEHVLQLPFELAALPQKFYNKVNLRVVSYALPALIAIGQVRHHHRPTRNPLTRMLRQAVRRRTLEVLKTIQPSTGGYLEATPLTSFVTMSLAGCGLGEHPVARRGVKFIVDSMRPDGSWAIDTNLATWVTTLSVGALAAGGRLHEHLAAEDLRRIRAWIIGQQYRDVHPYTGAAPGGWAWTDLPGGVPDADDTSGAMLALRALGAGDGGAGGGDEGERVRPGGPSLNGEAIEAGLGWLRGLQNRDGGIPTFCRGWGNLPFDRSSTDITAHYMRAVGGDARGAAFLRRSRQADGSWLPLWFGNQHHPAEENPTYGTSRVALATGDGAEWLLTNQNDDGGWGAGRGTPSSIEETALAVEAVAHLASARGSEDPPLNGAIERGVAWLTDRTARGTRFDPSPIGFYFAKLWYYEEMYPVIFTVAALERVAAWRESAGARPEPAATGGVR